MNATNLIVKSTPLCIAALLFPFSPTAADEALGAMSGVGGVMRDAEKRVESVAIPSKPSAPVPDPVPASSADATPSVKSKTLGPIVSVEVSGSTEFAAEHRIAERLCAELDDGADKTVADVRNALVKVRQEIMKEGFYLLRMTAAPSIAEAYDREGRSLKVDVSSGSFGTFTFTFSDIDEANDLREDGTWFSHTQMKRRFKKINEGDVFDYSTLRSALFDANAHPDVTIDTDIKVREERVATNDSFRIERYADLAFDVHESFPLHAVWEINNYGMKEVEEWQTSLTLQYLNLTRHDDVLTVSPQMSFGAELKSVAGSYMLPHDWWRGGNTTFYAGWSDLDVDDVVPRLDLEGTGWFAGLQHSETVYDSARHLWAVSAGILSRYMEDQYTAYGRYKLNKRDVSILPVSLAVSYTAKKPDAFDGRNFATLQGVFNLASSGDNLDEMWTGAEEHYKVLRWQLARLQTLFGSWDDESAQNLHRWMLFLKLEGQYTDDNLIPLEKLSLGGYNVCRGYRTRGYIGDYGAYGTAEVRSPILVNAVSSCFFADSDVKPVDRLQFLGFLDYGWTAFNDLPSGYDDDEWLCSAGFGVRAAFTKYSQLRFDVAFPLRDAYGNDDDVEVYLSIQTQF